ncbi:MAG: hypothetical protein AAF152_05310 [Cyanobacteria bacterium P01_A01_bin.114]
MRQLNLTRHYPHLLSSIQAALVAPSKFDYRLLTLAMLLGYFSIILIGSFFGPYHVLWQKLFNVKTMYPAFADLRVLTSGFECARLGYDVTLDNPCDPWGRPSPYPRLWWSLASLGIDQSHTVAIGIAMALLLYGMVFLFIGKLNLAQGVFYGLFLCSPTAMLMVERGNNDILIFYLFLGAIALLRARQYIVRLLGYGLIYFSMMLKLFPVFGLVVILRERRRRFWLTTLLVSVTVAIYLSLAGAEIDTISSISRAAESSPRFTYGPKILLLQLKQPQHFIRGLSNILAFLLLLPGVITLLRAAQPKLNKAPDLEQGPYVSAFRLGAAIFIATSLVSVSWDYRLFFIVLTLPQLFELIPKVARFAPGAAWLPSVTLLAVLSTMYLSNIAILDEGINGILLILYGYLFWLLLPRWLKQDTQQLINALK